jgi:hypothetical protein
MSTAIKFLVLSMARAPLPIRWVIPRPIPLQLVPSLPFEPLAVFLQVIEILRIDIVQQIVHPVIYFISRWTQDTVVEENGSSFLESWFFEQEGRILEKYGIGVGEYDFFK